MRGQVICWAIFFGVFGLLAGCGEEAAIPDQTAPILRLRSPQLVQLGAWVNLDASASEDDVGIVRYAVQFGDGDGEQDFYSPTLRHQYFFPGTFSLEVRAYDDWGRWDVVQRHLSVVEHLWPPYCDDNLACIEGASCDEGLCFVEGESSDEE